MKHKLTKHIGVDVCFTGSHCQQKTIALQHVSSKMQVADSFTKAQQENNIVSTYSNSMLQILRFHLEFEGGVKAHNGPYYYAYIYSTKS